MRLCFGFSLVGQKGRVCAREPIYKTRKTPETRYIGGGGFRHGSRQLAFSIQCVMSPIVQWCRPAVGITMIDMGVWEREKNTGRPRTADINYEEKCWGGDRLGLQGPVKQLVLFLYRGGSFFNHVVPPHTSRRQHVSPNILVDGDLQRTLLVGHKCGSDGQCALL